jgi:nuclear protein localization family protein 4
MKMHWTLAEFAALSAQYEFKVKPPKETPCAQVSLSGDACNVFQQYVRAYAFSPRCGFLYGRYDEGAKRTIVDVIYEPPQHVDASGELSLDGPSPEEADKLETVAKALGLERVGWIFSHPPRQMFGAGEGSDSEEDEDDDEYRFTAFELLESAEQQLDASGGNVEAAGNSKFVTVVVTANADGNAEFDAFQCSPLCLQMADAGALLEHETKPGLCKVSETFTAIVEGKPAPAVSTNFFIAVVAITQHTTPRLTYSFPVANRQDSPGAQAALRARLANTQRQPHAQRVADFQCLLALVDIMGADSVADICRSVMDPQVPMKEGYKLILDSLLQ